MESVDCQYQCVGLLMPSAPQDPKAHVNNPLQLIAWLS